MSKPTPICTGSICRSTIGASRGPQRRLRTITAPRRVPTSCGRSFGWRASVPSATTGWCATKAVFSSCSERRHYAPAQARVLVCEWPDGTLEIEYRGQTLPWREIATAPAQEAQRWTEKSVRGRKYVPPPDHPWRQGYEQRQRAALSEPTPTVVRVAASASP